MQGQFLIVGSAVVIAFVIVIVILHLVNRAEAKYYKNKIKSLEVQRNMVASTPVLLELSKVEPIIKNDKMEEKYNQWQERFENIKNDQIAKINDSIIELDINERMRKESFVAPMVDGVRIKQKIADLKRPVSVE